MVVDHEMLQGDSVALDFTIVDKAGAAINLTGASVLWKLSPAPQIDPLVSKATGSGIAITNGPGGLVTVSLVPADTASLIGTLYFEIEVTDGSGSVSTPRTGYIAILPAMISANTVPEPALIGEDGTGVAGAEAYGADPLALANAYWLARLHRAEAAKWLGSTPAVRKGALREAAAYMDATWETYCLGIRASYTQGRAWPRIAEVDDAGLNVVLMDAEGRAIPALPVQLVHAQAELAVRALTAPLASDDERGGMVLRKRERLGSLEEETEYAAGAPAQTAYGIVLGILAPILNGSQPGVSPTWFWR